MEIEKISEEKKNLIFHNVYKIMLKYDFNMLTLQSDSIKFDNGKLYNTNLKIYYDLSLKELAYINSLRFIPFEEFNNYYFHEEDKVKQKFKITKDLKRTKKKEEFYQSYDDFYKED